MTSSSPADFGSGPVGSSTQPCPLGQIHVEVALEDGRPADASVAFALSGPDSLEGAVASGQGLWSSPKILPGQYVVEVIATRAPTGYQVPAPVTCELPESGSVTARFALRPYAVLPVKVVRRGTGQGVAGVVVALSRGPNRHEIETSSGGGATFTRLVTSPPGYDVEVLAGPDYEPSLRTTWQPQPGTNPELRVELSPLGVIRARLLDTGSSASLTIPARFSLHSLDGGTVVEGVTNEAGVATFAGLAAGSYRLEATPSRPEDDCFTVDPSDDIVVEAGAEKDIDLPAARARSFIMMSDRATGSEVRGVLKDLIAATYRQARDDLAKRDIRRSVLVVPFTDLPFDDVAFEPDNWYWHDAREVIAVTGWVQASGARRQILFAHTYRPNRLILALAFKEWKFDREWVKALRGPITRHLDLADAFVVLSASETDLESADLPPEVSSFFGREKLDLKQGINLYGKLDVGGFPSLEQLFGWMGVKERYVKIQGYLGHDANLVFSRDASEQKQLHESTWELALSGTVPWPIAPPWDKLVTEREITLEVGFEQKAKGYPAGGLYNKGVAVRKRVTGKDAGTTPVEAEKTVHVKVEDAITVPLPSISVPWLLVVNEDEDVKFAGSFQVEQKWERRAQPRSPAPAEDGGAKRPEPKDDDRPEWTLEYGTDLTIALFAKEVAIHDFKAEVNIGENKLTLSGEIDLGRRERVAVIEFERPLPAKNKPAPPPAGGGTGAAGSTPNPTGTAKKKNPWTVTVKVKPGVAIGLADILKDLDQFLASYAGGSP